MPISWSGMVRWILLVLITALPPRIGAQELSIRLVGNAGVELSDGATSLLVDLPYESGAFGYERYDPAALQPPGTVVSVITHHHRDHFAPSVFLARAGWRIIAPASVTASLPAARVLAGDSVTIGAFAVIAVPSPHTPDHRSYRIRWHERVLHVTGDTERGASIPAVPHLDMLFVTPWLLCTVHAAGRAVTWDRAVRYHRQPDGSDRRCGVADDPSQGTVFTLSPARAEGGP